MSLVRLGFGFIFQSSLSSDSYSRSSFFQVFLNILYAASEYDELPIRHNEENYNEALSAKVPYVVDKNRLDDPHVKTNFLFQMVMQGMWFERDSPLWMLPCMSEDLLSSLQNGGISNIQLLLDLPRMNLQSRFGNGALKLQQSISCFYIRKKF
ncbi:DExH-box ATP-dependent RNA helicase DExH14 isoform X2 [Tanacetum coccineum]